MPGAPEPSGGPPRAPRRLSREARYRQLIAAAMPLAARKGLADISLEDLATRAGVTRNLLYHYFPRGRADLVPAVVQEAERQLAPPPVTVNADSVPTGAAASANIGASQADLGAMLDHALAPTHAWRIHRMAAASADPEVRATISHSAARWTQALSRAHLGTSDPPPLVDVGLRGYIGFAEAAIDHGRAVGVPRIELAGLLELLLAATLDAARRGQPVSSASHAAD